MDAKTKEVVLTAAVVSLVVSLLTSFTFLQMNKPPSKTVGIGDIVTVRYTSYFENGSAYDSGNFTFVVGKGQVIKGIDEGVVGMREGEKKELVVPPEKGFGNYNENLTLRMPLIRTQPRVLYTLLQNFTAIFGEAPMVGKSYKNAGMNWPVRVVNVSGNVVTLSQEPERGQSFELTYGTLVVLDVNETSIQTRLIPRKGAGVNIPYGNMMIRGVIKSVGENDMLVDLNHPLAGKTMRYEVEVVRVLKRAYI